MIHLGIGQPDPRLLPEGLFQQGQCHWQDLAYGEQAGDEVFRTALSSWLTAAYQQPVGPDELMITNGASNALDMICSQFSEAGQTVLVEDPTYFIARQLFAGRGLNVQSVPMEADGVDLAQLEALLASSKPAFFYCIPSFHNPTGITYSAAKRQALAALAKKYQCLLVADEVYQHLYFQQPPPKPLACWYAEAPVLSVHTFSKILAPGLRLGWIQSRHSSLQQLISAPLLKSGGGLAPMTSAWVRPLLEQGDFHAYLSGLRKSYSNRCRTLVAALRREFGDGVHFAEPAGGYFLWLRLDGVSNSQSLLELARGSGMAFMPANLFSTSPHWSGYLRLCFALYGEADLVEAVSRLKQARDSRLRVGLNDSST